MARSTTHALVSRIVAEIPALQPLHEEHLADNFGELLPHVLCGAITRFVQDRVAADDRSVPQDVLKLLGILEEAMKSADADVLELVSLSFLENLDRRGAGYRRLRAAMGPMLRDELARYERQ